MINKMIKEVFRIRVGLNTDLDIYSDQDPAFEVNTDPTFEVNTDPDPDPGSFMTNILQEFYLFFTVFITNFCLEPPLRSIRVKSKDAVHYK